MKRAQKRRAAKKSEPACKKLQTPLEFENNTPSEDERLDQEDLLKLSSDEETKDHTLFIFPRPTRLFFFVALFLSEAAFMENT